MIELCEEGSWSFRPGRATDYIATCTGYDFDPDFAVAKKWRDDYDQCMAKVFHGEEMDHWKDVLSWFIDGRLSRTQRFLILTGHGNNMKSVIGKMIKLMLGDYHETV